MFPQAANVAELSDEERGRLFVACIEEKAARGLL
jgi:hypothetical protein